MFLWIKLIFFSVSYGKYTSRVQFFCGFVLTAGNEHLSVPDAVQNEVLPAAVKLGQHIIQQQHGIFAVLIEKQLALGKL